MLGNFIFSANAVFPIFLVIAFGYFLRKKNFVSSGALNEMNGLVFNFALPLLLFRNIYQADFRALFDPNFILWLIISLCTCFAFLWIFAEIYLRKRQELVGAFVQASFRANYAIVGLPLVANIMGGNDTGKAALAAAFVVTSFNVLSVIVLTVKSGQKKLLNSALFKTVVISICRNPSIIAIVIGVSINLTGISLPQIISSSVNYMAVLCTPLALIALGGSIQISEIMQQLKPAIVGVILKIAVLPAIFVTASVMLGFRGEALATIFAVFANPTAIMSYVMADRMNANTTITSAIILFTTIFSSVTLTIGVYLLRTFSLI